MSARKRENQNTSISQTIKTIRTITTRFSKKFIQTDLILASIYAKAPAATYHSGAIHVALMEAVSEALNYYLPITLDFGDFSFFGLGDWIADTMAAKLAKITVETS